MTHPLVIPFTEKTNVKNRTFLVSMDVMSLDTNIQQNKGILKLSVTKHMKISTKTTLPWVPEDIFFLSILMVRGVVASTVENEPLEPG